MAYIISGLKSGTSYSYSITRPEETFEHCEEDGKHHFKMANLSPAREKEINSWMSEHLISPDRCNIYSMKDSSIELIPWGANSSLATLFALTFKG